MSLFERRRGIRPPEPKASRNFVLVVLDSCRFDTFVEARPAVIGQLGEIEKRYSYATWTAPSHYNILTGLMPHVSPRHVFASDLYQREYARYDERLDTTGIDFGRLVPHLYLPTLLRAELGYYTHARVSMPVLNPATAINKDFDSFHLMDAHNDFRAMLGSLKFSSQRPSFYLLNLGETHFPYATAEEDPAEWPTVQTLRGKMNPKEPSCAGGPLRPDDLPGFDLDAVPRMRSRQVRAVQAIDAIFEELFDLLPENTWVTVTSDHGELFGEDGYFGHGPIQHAKVLEVPFVEGLLR